MIFYSINSEQIIADVSKTMPTLEFISIIELMYLEGELWNKKSANIIYNKVKSVLQLYEKPYYESLSNELEAPEAEKDSTFEFTSYAHHLTPGEKAFCLAIAMGSPVDKVLRNIYRFEENSSDNFDDFYNYKTLFIIKLKEKFLNLNLVGLLNLE